MTSQRSMPALTDLILGLLRRLSALFPEGASKNGARAWLLNFRCALPRELMVGSGQTVIQVGMWRKRNLDRLARLVGEKGRIFLVEADSRVASDLEEFAKASGHGNVTVVNRGASDQTGTRTMRVGTSPSFNRLAGAAVQMPSEIGGDAFEATQEITVDTLDNIAAEYGIDRVDYVEISVNGLEIEVLKGMTELLPRVNRLFMSGYARIKQTGEPTNQATQSLLRGRGFSTRLSKRQRPRRDFFDAETAREWGLMEGNVFAWRQ